MLLAMLRTLAWVLAHDAEGRQKQVDMLIDFFLNGGAVRIDISS